MGFQQVEQLPAVAPPLVADVRRGRHGDHEVQAAEHEDVLAAETPREAGAVPVESLAPPAVAVLAIRIPP